MNKVLKLSLVIFVLTLSLMGAFLAYRFNQLLTSANTTLQTVQTDLHGTSQNLNAALIQIGLVSDETRRASMEQRVYWQKNSKETHTVLVSLNKTIIRADGTIADLDAEILKNGNEVATLLRSGQQTTHILSLAGLELGALVRHTDENMQTLNPNIQAAVKSLNESSDHVSHATDSLANASKDVEVKIHQLTRPASFAKSLGMTILDIGAKLGSVVTGFFK